MFRMFSSALNYVLPQSSVAQPVASTPSTTRVSTNSSDIIALADRLEEVIGIMLKYANPRFDHAQEELVMENTDLFENIAQAPLDSNSIWETDIHYSGQRFILQFSSYHRGGPTHTLELFNHDRSQQESISLTHVDTLFSNISLDFIQEKLIETHPLLAQYTSADTMGSQAAAAAIGVQQAGAATVVTSLPYAMTGTCPCCMDPFAEIIQGGTKITTLPCNHSVCDSCLDGMKAASDVNCPECREPFDVKKGNMPAGTMAIRTISTRLPGFENDSTGTIEITYDIPDGIQNNTHPNPGLQFSGTYRVAYLPANNEGRRVLALLQKAWEQKLTFTVGKSVTTGQENTVIWNDIHHKTSFSGTYGYPDPTYLERVTTELNAKGIE